MNAIDEIFSQYKFYNEDSTLDKYSFGKPR